MRRAGVIGAGAWGTALAQVCARAGLDVRLWALEAETAQAINEAHENTPWLPGVALEPEIVATTALSDLSDADLLLAVVPAQHMRGTLAKFAADCRPGLPVVLCSKGFEQGSLKMMTEVLAETLPQARPAVLSGPSFAAEVARGLPTAVTLACPDEALAADLAEAIATPAFRPYLAADIVGAEVGGAVKNVLALACGIVEGKGLGRSAHAALITRGFAEMTRLGVALGAKAETLSGLCGLGDLVLTCSSPMSRNMSTGMALGRGEALADILASRAAVVEGVASAAPVAELAGKLGVDAPICQAVAAIVAGRLGVDAAIEALLARPLRPERSDAFN
ncbi:MAG: NAD(P)H-dependent glycerol-3-phosphate dehydrogenase [Phenylobacterium sp.]